MPVHVADYPKPINKPTKHCGRVGGPIVWGEWTPYIGGTIQRTGFSAPNVMHREVKRTEARKACEEEHK